MRFLFLLLVVLAGSAGSARAQTEYSNPGIQRSENRRALRDARKAKVPYKDSHLGVSKKELRQGGSPDAALARKRDVYKFDHTGAAYVREPIRLGLRPAGKKKKPENE